MRLAKLLLCSLPFAVALPAVADVTVYGTSSIWLAGQPSGTTTVGYFGSDSAPGNSPVAVTVGGTYATFSATGTTTVDVNNGTSGGPGGDTIDYPSEAGFSPTPFNTMYDGPGGALVGIFTNGTAPTIETVGGYTGPTLVSGTSTTSTPSLDQIFIIGTGGTFAVPTGATELYLGVGDALGGSNDNGGSFDVTESFSDVAPTPEPGSLVLLGTGALSVLGMVRRRRA